MVYKSMLNPLHGREILDTTTVKANVVVHKQIHKEDCIINTPQNRHLYYTS